MNSSTRPTPRLTLTLVALWLGVSGLFLLVNIPLWLDIVVVLLATIFSAGIWKLRQARLLLDNDHLSEQLQRLSDSELQDALEGVAEFKASLGQVERLPRPIQKLLHQLSENQLLLMKEQLDRSGFYDDVPPAMSGVYPVVTNYSSDNTG